MRIPLLAVVLALLAAAGLDQAFRRMPAFDPLGRVRWRLPGSHGAKRCAITFDDGPSPSTAAVLDILAAEENVNEAKAPPYHAGVAEQVAHLLRMRRSGDVEILGPAREHQVAHAAADQLRVVAGAGEAIENLEDVGVDIAP